MDEGVVVDDEIGVAVQLPRACVRAGGVADVLFEPCDDAALDFGAEAVVAVVFGAIVQDHEPADG